MVFQGASFEFLGTFGLYPWFLLVASSIVNILSSTTKFLACKYHTASDLQKLAFLPNVWQFCIDLVFLKATFSGMELAGFISLFVFYIGYLAHVGHTSCKKVVNVDDGYERANDLEKGATEIASVRHDTLACETKNYNSNDSI